MPSSSPRRMPSASVKWSWGLAYSALRSSRAFHSAVLPIMTVSMTRYSSNANWSWRKTPIFFGRVTEPLVESSSPVKIFINVDLRRYAITGPNGAGKSTFMKILTGELDSTSGSVTRPKKMGVLRQDQFAFDEYRVIDTVIMGNAALWKALVERDALYAKPHEQLTDADGMRLGELEGIVGEEGGYTAEADAAVLLDGLGVEDELHERKMGELQGGQKVRVLLAQALFGNPTALLLDEPTNNLDLDSVHWLQRYLCDYEGVLIVISHDRHFLNSVCTYTADIDYETIIMYVGGYDDMVMAKTQIRGRIEADNANREKKIAQLQEFIARFSAGTRSAQATSRKKEVERLQTAELARSNIQRPYIKFDMKRNSGKHPLEIRSVEKSYDDLKVIP